MDSMPFDSLVFIFIYDSILGFFLQGGQGGYLRSVPLSPFDPQPLHALQLFVLRTDYVIVHSASSMLI